MVNGKMRQPKSRENAWARSGIKVRFGGEETPWGTREFPVLDLERNLLTFYERISG